MQIDLGIGVILLATLFFYLRLIIIQQQKVRRQSSQPQANKKKKNASPSALEQYSIISRNRRDWVIAGTGVLIVVFGILLKVGILPIAAAAPYWWIPVSLGIVACNWGFQ